MGGIEYAKNHFKKRNACEIPDGSQQDRLESKKTVSEFHSGKRKAISKYEMRSNDRTAFRFQPAIKNVSKKKSVKKVQFAVFALQKINKVLKIKFGPHAKKIWQLMYF